MNRVTLQLVASFTIIIYDRHIFIVQQGNCDKFYFTFDIGTQTETEFTKYLRETDKQ